MDTLPQLTELTKRQLVSFGKHEDITAKRQFRLVVSMSFSDWFKEQLGESAQDIAQHGADCGFGCITYTKDCVELYDRFAEEIWEMLVEDSESLGHKNPMEFVATFKLSDMTETPDQFKNLLLWFACERLAHSLVEEVGHELA